MRRNAAILLLCCIATTAVASPVQDLLDRHASAHGLSRDTVDPRCTHSIATLRAFGLEGRLESWAQAPLRTRGRLELGPLVIETWFDGERGWIADRNGSVREAEASERGGLLLDALQQTGAYALRQPPVPLRYALVEDDDSTTVALELIPMMSESITLLLDPRSAELVSTRWESGQGTEETAIVESELREGQLVATRSRMRIAGTMEIEAELEVFEKIAPRPLEFYEPRGDHDQDLLFDDGIDIVELGLRGDGYHLLIEGRLNENLQGLFLVDTGAASNVIDRNAAEAAGLEVEGEIATLGVGGAATSGLVHIERLDLGGLHLRGQSWIAIDLSEFTSWFGEPLLGVLGYDFLDRVVVDIDYPARRLLLRRRGSWSPPESAVELTLRMDANVPTVSALVEGIEAPLHVDTGSNGWLELSAPFVEEHGLLEGRETEKSDGLRGVGGTTRPRLGQTRTLELGAWSLEDVETNFHRSTEGIFATTQVAGLLGARIFAREHIVFDYGNRKMWIFDRSE